MDVIESYKVTFMGEGKVSLIRCLRKKTNTKINVGAIRFKILKNILKSQQNCPLCENYFVPTLNIISTQ